MVLMLLKGKKGLIIGVANKHSIAWAIAQSTAGQGAQLLFNYQNERLKQNVEELAATLPGAKAFPCDVSNDGEIASLMQQVQKEVGHIDFLVHSLAFAPREELSGQFVNTTRQGFATALDISAYSLVAVARAALPLMTVGGSIVTLTYLGTEQDAGRTRGLRHYQDGRLPQGDGSAPARNRTGRGRRHRLILSQLIGT